MNENREMWLELDHYESSGIRGGKDCVVHRH